MDIFSKTAAAATMSAAAIFGQAAPAKAGNEADIIIGIIGGIAQQQQMTRCAKELSRDYGISRSHAFNLCARGVTPRDIIVEPRPRVIIVPPPRQRYYDEPPRRYRRDYYPY